LPVDFERFVDFGQNCLNSGVAAEVTKEGAAKKQRHHANELDLGDFTRAA
jgi:hypothetical protein